MMNGARSFVGVAVLCFFVASLGHTAANAQVGIGAVSKQTVAILPPQGSVTRLVGGPQDAATVSQHFNDSIAQAEFFAFVHQLGYQPMSSQGVLVSSPDGGSVLVLPLLPLIKNDTVESPIEIVVHARFGGASGIFLYQLFFDRTTRSPIAQVFTDPFTNFGLEMDFTTGLVSELSGSVAPRLAPADFIRCVFNNLLKITASEACSALSGISMSILTASVLAAILDNPIGIAAVVGAIVATVGTQIVCSGVACVREGETLDQQAQRDMERRAATDARFFDVVSKAFGADVTWTSDWELRWQAFNFSGSRVVYIYHATAKRDSSHRLTIFFDPDKGEWTNWQLAS